MSAAIQTTSHRLPNGHHQLRRAGVTVGEAWRWPVRVNGKRPGGFGLRIDGFFWNKGEASRTPRGNTTTAAKSLREAIAIADEVLSKHS